MNQADVDALIADHGTWLKSSITDPILEDCNLPASTFRRAYLKGCKLNRCSIAECDFIRSKIMDTEFVEVVVANSRFDESSLNGFKFHELSGIPASHNGWDYQRIFSFDPNGAANNRVSSPWR